MLQFPSSTTTLPSSSAAGAGWTGSSSSSSEKWNSEVARLEEEISRMRSTAAWALPTLAKKVEGDSEPFGTWPQLCVPSAASEALHISSDKQYEPQLGETAVSVTSQDNDENNLSL